MGVDGEYQADWKVPELKGKSYDPGSFEGTKAYEPIEGRDIPGIPMPASVDIPNGERSYSYEYYPETGYRKFKIAYDVNGNYLRAYQYSDDLTGNVEIKWDRYNESEKCSWTYLYGVTDDELYRAIKVPSKGKKYVLNIMKDGDDEGTPVEFNHIYAYVKKDGVYVFQYRFTEIYDQGGRYIRKATKKDNVGPYENRITQEILPSPGAPTRAEEGLAFSPVSWQNSLMGVAMFGFLSMLMAGLNSYAGGDSMLTAVLTVSFSITSAVFALQTLDLLRTTFTWLDLLFTKILPRRAGPGEQALIPQLRPDFVKVFPVPAGAKEILYEQDGKIYVNVLEVQKRPALVQYWYYRHETLHLIGIDHEITVYAVMGLA